MSWREAWKYEPALPNAHDSWGAWAQGGAKGTEDGSGGMPASPDATPFLVLFTGDPVACTGYTYEGPMPEVGGAASMRVRARLFVTTPTATVRLGFVAYRADASRIGELAEPDAANVRSATGWTDVEYVLSLPPGTGLVQPFYRILGPDPAWCGLDYIELDAWAVETFAGASSNLLVNGGFRDGLVGWENVGNPHPGGAGWTYWNDEWGTATLADGDTNNPETHVGSTMSIAGTGTGTGMVWPAIGQRVPVVEGHRYTVSCLMAGSGDSTPGLRLFWLDAAGAQIGDPLYGSATGTNGPDVSTWGHAVMRVDAPPGAAFLRVDCYVNYGNTLGLWSGAWFDQVGVYEGDVVPPWENTGPGELGAKGYPGVEIEGLRYDHLTLSATWSLGRSAWFAAPEPGTASVELEGDRTEVNPGDPFRIVSPGGSGSSVLFVGAVDDVVVGVSIVDGEVVRVTRVTATDYMAWLARTTVSAFSHIATDFERRVGWIANAAGLEAGRRETVYMPAATLPPDVPPLATGTDRVTLAAVLDQQERLANTIVQVGPDGRWRLLHRVALGSTRPQGLDLSGDNCPYEATLDRQSVQKVINRWVFTDADQDYTGQLPGGGYSIPRYGPTEYAVGWPVATSGARYPNAMRYALAQALTSWSIAVRVARRAVAIQGVGPFDYVSWRGRQYQALQVAHRVAPGSWEVALHLDATQSVISGGATGDETTPPDPVPPDVPPPEPPPPPPEPPPVVRKRATVTLTANQDGYAVRTSGGSNSGNGASGNILVGLLADGHLCRGFVGFPSTTFLGRNRTVVSATLQLVTNRGGCMTWGSSPKFTVRRVTAGWSEGTHATACSFITGNALKYPGPTTTTSGAVTVGFSGGDSKSVSARIDAIAQAWLDGSAQYGVALFGASESSSANRSAFDAAGSGRAKLVLTYEYDE